MKQTPKAQPQAITIVDVAHEAGVSYATVSRVMNNAQEHIRPETRARVLQAATRLGYVANRQARSLRGGRTRTIGLLVRELGTGYIGEIVRGIDGELLKQGYELLLHTTHWRQKSEVGYVETLTRGMVDGLLLILPHTPEQYLARLRLRKFPHVLVDPQINDPSAAVGVTNQQGAYDAVHYLISLGHRCIGFISGKQAMYTNTERFSGYWAALRDAGIAFDERLVVEGDYFQASGFAGAQALLRLPERPTAIFAANDTMAFGAMEAIRDQGLRIPEDISIIGFDDVPQASSTYPRLTTVRQPLAEMGQVATQTLLAQIENPEQKYERVLLPTQLVIRASCQTRQGLEGG